MRRPRLPIAPIAAFLLILAFSPAAIATILVELGSAQVDLSPGSGVATVSFDVDFSNTMATAAPIAGYSLFLDIGPSGSALPAGVSFADPAVTYIAGLGTLPLPLAGPGTMNLTPAAGDLGLGQIQFSDGTIGPGESFTILTVNLTVDRAQASSGVFDISLNPLGENSLDAITGQQPFGVTTGALTLTAAPTLPGDFDFDTDVDGFDFLLWQRGQSPVPLSAEDLADWKSNFGMNSSTPTGTTVIAVPEPDALFLLIFASVVVVGYLCQRRRISPFNFFYQRIE